MEQGELFLRGENFMRRSNDQVSVSLSGVTLGLVSQSEAEILARLPSGIEPGTYRLVVIRSGPVPGADAMDVTLGAAGPAGPEGQVGPQGPMGDTGPQGLPGIQGPPGEDGKDGEPGPVGPEGLVWRGAWAEAAAYASDDAVQFEGSSWVATRENTAVPPAAGADWSLLASKGDPGETGERGERGSQGPQGVKGDQGDRGEQGSPGTPGILPVLSCPPGNALGGITATGAPYCFPVALPAPLPPDALDSSGDVGRFPSVTIGGDGLPLVSYYDATNGDLKVAHCTDVACASAQITTVDGTAGVDVGQYTSITTGSDGLGLISYYDVTNGDLKVAHCSDPDCSNATITRLDADGDVGQSGSITRGADGFGLISYRDLTNKDLKVAHCQNADCTSVQLTTLDAAGSVGLCTAITRGADGLGLISYCADGVLEIRVAHCSDTPCTTATITTVKTSGEGLGGSEYTSIAVGGDGLGLMSFSSGLFPIAPHAAHCENAACTNVFKEPLVSVTGLLTVQGAITIGADGFGLMVYQEPAYPDGRGPLHAVHCAGPRCSSRDDGDSSRSRIPETDNARGGVSVTIGSDGLPLIVFYDGVLKVVHCRDRACLI
jgi:hypothetical protein